MKKIVIFTICLLLLTGCQKKEEIKTIVIKSEPNYNQVDEMILGSSGDAINTSAGDGYVAKGDSADWNTSLNASIGSLTNYTGIVNYAGSGYNLLTSNYDFRRAFLPFDTSAIPANATIISATLSVYATNIFDYYNDGYDYVGIVSTTQATTAKLVNADYNKCGATTTSLIGGSKDLGDFATSTYGVITLNSTGLSWIKKSGETSNCSTTPGITCLGLREGHDLQNIEFSTINILGFSSFDGANSPYLTITYSVPEPEASIKIQGTANFQGTSNFQ